MAAPDRAATGLELDEDIDRELENLLNHPAPPYSEAEYWNARYRDNKLEIEWFVPFSTIKPFIAQHLPSSAKGAALVPGCGNSSLSQELLAHYARVVSTDIAQSVIEKMRDKHRTETRLEWLVQDGSKPALSERFDCVFDKGFLDTLLCYDNPGKVIESYLKETTKFLKGGGLFFVVSYGVPKTRKRFWEKPLHLQEVLTVEAEGVKRYVYVLRNGE